MTISETLAAVEKVYGVFGDDARISEERLDQSEQRLGTRLPDALRTVYLRTGQHPLHHACDTLVPPEQLAFSDDSLVFYEQQQGSIFWAICRDDLTSADPAVRALYGDDDEETRVDSPSVSISSRSRQPGKPSTGVLSPSTGYWMSTLERRYVFRQLDSRLLANSSRARDTGQYDIGLGRSQSIALKAVGFLELQPQPTWPFKRLRTISGLRSTTGPSRV